MMDEIKKLLDKEDTALLYHVDMQGKPTMIFDHSPQGCVVTICLLADAIRQVKAEHDKALAGDTDDTQH